VVSFANSIGDLIALSWTRRWLEPMCCSPAGLGWRNRPEPGWRPGILSQPDAMWTAADVLARTHRGAPAPEDSVSRMRQSDLESTYSDAVRPSKRQAAHVHSVLRNRQVFITARPLFRAGVDPPQRCRVFVLATLHVRKGTWANW